MAKTKNKKSLLFIWIPKTGGTSVANMFSLIPMHRIRYDPSPLIRLDASHMTFGHADITEVLNKKIISQKFYDTSFKFCIVRNPYDRAVSLFYYQGYLRKCPKKFTFKEFIQFLSKNKSQIPKNTVKNTSCTSDGYINNQWNQMVSWIPEDINKIFKFEDFNNIPSQINNLSGNNIGFELKHLNSRKSRETKEHKSYREEYDEDTKKLVYQLFKDDFERFGYEF